MELGSLVALRPACGVLGLARAELAEVLGCLGNNIFEELKGDAAEWLAWMYEDVSMSVSMLSKELYMMIEVEWQEVTGYDQ